MENSRRDFLKISSKVLGTVALGSPLISACAPAIQRSFPEWHGHDYKFQDRTEGEEPYKLERAVIFGKQFYIQRVSVGEGELPFIYLPFNKTRRVITINTGKVRLESDENYLPRRVRVEDYTEDEFADEVDLMMNRSPEGIKGVRADILSLEELRRKVGISRDSHGFSGGTTELDAEYNIRTMSIFGVEYFFPHVETSKTGEPGNLDFYLMPVKGTEIVIRNSDGGIALRNRNNIYRPTTLLAGYEEENSPSQAKRIRGD